VASVKRKKGVVAPSEVRPHLSAQIGGAAIGRLARLLHSSAAWSARAADFLNGLADAVARQGHHKQRPPGPPCLDCNGQGWLHMTSGLHGREIQRCDSCRVYSMDEDATAVHDMDCGCAWAGSEEEELEYP
jgi:hypothetical protein